jgi:hypothetical protein
LRVHFHHRLTPLHPVSAPPCALVGSLPQGPIRFRFQH